MTEEFLSGEEFIYQWFEEANQNDELDKDVLGILEGNMDEADLDEERTFEGLVEKAKNLGEDHG